MDSMGLYLIGRPPSNRCPPQTLSPKSPGVFQSQPRVACERQDKSGNLAARLDAGWGYCVEGQVVGRTKQTHNQTEHSGNRQN